MYVLYQCKEELKRMSRENMQMKIYVKNYIELLNKWIKNEILGIYERAVKERLEC